MNKDGYLFALLSGWFARHFLRVNEGSLLSQEKLAMFSGNYEIQDYNWKLELFFLFNFFFLLYFTL